MLSNLIRTGSFTAAIIAATLFGCSIGSGVAEESKLVAQDNLTDCLRFQDYTTREALLRLSDQQVFCMRRQALEAFREERRWAMFMGYPNSDMLLPDDSPLNDLLWNEAFTDEARQHHNAALGQASALEVNSATNPNDRSLAQIDIMYAAKHWEQTHRARRKLSRDIIEKVYLIDTRPSGSHNIDLLYTPHSAAPEDK